MADSTNNALELIAQLNGMRQQPLDLQSYIDSMAQMNTASSIGDTADAWSTLQDTGVDPFLIIGVNSAGAKYVDRRDARRARIEMQQAEHAERLRHQQAINEAKEREAKARAEIAEAQAKRMSAPLPSRVTEPATSQQ